MNYLWLAGGALSIAALGHCVIVVVGGALGLAEAWAEVSADAGSKAGVVI